MEICGENSFNVISCNKRRLTFWLGPEKKQLSSKLDQSEFFQFLLLIYSEKCGIVACGTDDQTIVGLLIFCQITEEI